MAQFSEEKRSRREFVTVKDAMELLERSDRQIRRMIANKKLTAIRDEHGGVWIDLHDVQRKSNGRLRSAVEELRGRVREQLDEQTEAIDFLKAQMAEQAQAIQELTMIIGHLQESLKRIVAAGARSEQREDTGSDPSLVSYDMTRLSSLLNRTDLQHSRLEKRDLLAGTHRLAAFAELHVVSIDAIKGLYRQGAIQLTIFHRQAHAIRNKQEWWISTQQQYDLVQYWLHYQVPYTPCPECPHSFEEVAHIE